MNFSTGRVNQLARAGQGQVLHQFHKGAFFLFCVTPVYFK